MIEGEIEFKGWKVSIEFLESQIALCRKFGAEELRFGVAGMSRDKASEFIDPEEGKAYDYEQYKLFVRGVSYVTTGWILSTNLDPNSTFDDFPPIPPEPIQDPG